MQVKQVGLRWFRELFDDIKPCVEWEGVERGWRGDGEGVECVCVCACAGTTPRATLAGAYLRGHLSTLLRGGVQEVVLGHCPY